MEVTRDHVGEFVEWGDKAKDPCAKRADGDGGEEIPGEEFDGASSAGVAFAPGDVGM